MELTVPPNCSNSIINISKKLFEIQKECNGVKKNVANSFYKNKYPDLKQIYDLVRDLCTAHSILLQQGYAPLTDPSEYDVIIVTRLVDVESGEWMEYHYRSVPKEKSHQGQGIASTYGKRYALLGIFCIPTLDDDGEGAMERPTSSSTKKVSPKNVKVISIDQVTEISDMFRDKKFMLSDVTKFLKMFGGGVEEVKDIAASHYSAVKGALKGSGILKVVRGEK
jgi:uncharacterized protein YfkK (UPF0435 family)